MPQKKRKSAEEILGITQPRKSAEELLGIAPVPSAPAPSRTGQVPSEFNVGVGAARGGLDLGNSALAFIEAVGSAAGGDFRPLGDIAERAGRGALPLIQGLAAGPFGATAAYQTEAALQEPQLKAVRQRQEARRATSPAFQAARKADSAIKLAESLDPSVRGRITRGVTSAGVQALPAVAAGVVSGGSVPAAVGATALQSFAEPENLVTNVALEAVPVASIVAPILRRVRGGRAAVESAEAVGSAIDDAGENFYRPISELPELIEAPARPFRVSARGATARQPGAVGPRMVEFAKDSKVVDPEGNPLVVYHGTGAEFDEFQRGVEGRRVYFTESPEAAQNYARLRSNEGSEGFVKPVYLSIKNPFDLSAPLDPREANRLVNAAARVGGISNRDARDLLRFTLEGGQSAPRSSLSPAIKEQLEALKGQGVIGYHGVKEVPASTIGLETASDDILSPSNPELIQGYVDIDDIDIGTPEISPDRILMADEFLSRQGLQIDVPDPVTVSLRRSVPGRWVAVDGNSRLIALKLSGAKGYINVQGLVEDGFNPTAADRFFFDRPGGPMGRTNAQLFEAMEGAVGGATPPGQLPRVLVDDVLRYAGYDGIKMPAEELGVQGSTWVAFSPKQIKSAVSEAAPTPKGTPISEASGPGISQYGFIQGSPRLTAPGGGGGGGSTGTAAGAGALGPSNPAIVTPAQRTPVLEIISALRKAGLLTGLKTHLKNIGGNVGFALSEEASRVPAAILDLVISPITKRRTITGPSFGAVAKSAYEAATKGVREAVQIIRQGATAQQLAALQLPQEINSGSRILDTYVNGVFRLLNAEDKVFKTYAFRRSLEDRARSIALTEIRSGQLVKGDYGKRVRDLVNNPPAPLEAEALADAEVATFTEANALADAFGKGKEALPKGGQFITDMFFPFVKTPTNIVKRMLEYAGGGFGKNLIQAAKAITQKSFTEAEQRAFAQTFGRASLGTGLIALGWKLAESGSMTGFIEDDPTRRARDEAAGRIPGAIKAGDRWLQVIGFAPMGNLLALGATLQREMSQEREDAALGAVAEVIASAIGEQPLLIGSKQIAESLKAPGTTGERLLGGIAGSFVPTMVSDIAEAVDPEQRQMRTFADRVLKRVPGARGTLPAGQDVLGQPRQDTGPVGAFLDPTRSQTALETSNPLFAELVRLDQGISGFRKKPDETEEEYAERVQSFGQLYGQYGRALMSNAQYRRSNDETKKEAFTSLNARARTLISEGKEENAPGVLSASAIFQAIADKRLKQQLNPKKRK